MKKAMSLILAAGLVLAGVPGGAQVFGPNTVWGTAPAAASSAANAVLLDMAGNTVATVPVIDGKFAFRDVVPGQYQVSLQTATGQELARSLTADLATGAEVEAIFGSSSAAAAVLPGSTAAAATGGGLGTTGLILIGAAAVGITAAVVILANDDDDDAVASPSR